MKLKFSRQIFKIGPSIKFHENHSSGSRDVPCGRTDKQAKTKLTVTFSNFTNAHNNPTFYPQSVCMPLFMDLKTISDC
jgi:hypothetical protein